jgi:hypothetical protein
LKPTVRFIKLLQTTAILFVAALYCLAPLQQPLADGFHKLEHAILNTNGNHSHDFAHDNDSSHAHKHQALSFFKDLFQENAQGDEQAVKTFELDKHIVQRNASQNKLFVVISNKNFNYTLGNYSVSLPFTLPPPEEDFSYL